MIFYAIKLCQYTSRIIIGSFLLIQFQNVYLYFMLPVKAISCLLLFITTSTSLWAQEDVAANAAMGKGCIKAREDALEAFNEGKPRYFYGGGGFSFFSERLVYDYFLKNHYHFIQISSSCLQTPLDMGYGNCYNRTIDSLMLKVKGIDLHKDLNRKLDSLNSSVPPHRLPELYHTALDIIYMPEPKE